MKKPITRLCAVSAALVVAMVGGASAASASDGGLEVDNAALQLHNVAPGHPQVGYVQMTNSASTMLYISAITLNSNAVAGVSLTYDACSVPWVDGVCSESTLTVADYDLTTLPTQVQTLDYAIEAGHTTYFKLRASTQQGGAITANSNQRTLVEFKWVAQDQAPAGRPVSVMPSQVTRHVALPPAVTPVPVPTASVTPTPVVSPVPVASPQPQATGAPREREDVVVVRSPELPDTGVGGLRGIGIVAGVLIAGGVAARYAFKTRALRDR